MNTEQPEDSSPDDINAKPLRPQDLAEGEDTGPPLLDCSSQIRDRVLPQVLILDQDQQTLRKLSPHVFSIMPNEHEEFLKKTTPEEREGESGNDHDKRWINWLKARNIITDKQLSTAFPLRNIFDMEARGELDFTTYDPKKDKPLRLTRLLTREGVILEVVIILHTKILIYTEQEQKEFLRKKAYQE